MITEKEIRHIAVLARLKLTGPEIKKYQKQLSEILDYIGQLKKVSTKNIEPCAGGTNLKNVFRQDEPVQSDNKTRKKLLDAAPVREGNLIKTKGVFAEK